MNLMRMIGTVLRVLGMVLRKLIALLETFSGEGRPSEGVYINVRSIYIYIKISVLIFMR